MPADGATCLASRCFCEAVHASGLAQPANAWSSLAFVAVGLVVLVPVGAPVGVPGRRERVLVVLLGVAMVAVGAASFGFHATLSRLGELLDVWSMCALAIVVLGGGLVRSGLARPRAAVLGGLALLAGLLRILWTWPETRRWVFAVLLLSGIAVEVRRIRMPFAVGQPQRWLWLGLGVLGAAYAIWLLDQGGTWCDPESLVQGHALWHGLGAASGWCLARHYMATPDVRRVGP